MSHEEFQKRAEAIAPQKSVTVTTERQLIRSPEGRSEDWSIWCSLDNCNAIRYADPEAALLAFSNKIKEAAKKVGAA